MKEAAGPGLVLALRDVNTFRGPAHVLRKVSVSVRNGETVCLVGRNGAGKTTTMDSIMGLLPVRSGAVVYRGREITALGPHLRARMGIGYAPDDCGIFPDLTVAEHLRIGQWLAPGRRAAGDGSAAGDPAGAIYDLFPELRRLLLRKGLHLSGGEKKMVAIARSMMLRPAVLLLDEAFEGLAPAVVNRFADAVRKIQAMGISMLIAESNVMSAAKVADRLYVIDRGEIIFDGTPAEVFRHEGVMRTIRGYRGAARGQGGMGPMRSLARGLMGMPGVIWRAIRARPGIFLGVALAVVVLDLCLPLFVLSVFRKPWDHFSFNPWLRNLPGWLLSPTQTLARKVEFVSDVSLFWFIASSPYDAAEWGFSVGLQDLLRWLYMGGVFGAYFALWLYGRARLARRPWQGGGRGGAAGAVLSTLGLATAPCSVAGCGLPVLPVMGLALQGLTSGTLAALATVSRLATQAVLVGMTLAVVALACLIAVGEERRPVVTQQQERRGEGLTKA